MKKVKVGDKEVFIRAIKFKEIKEFTGTISVKTEEVFEIFSGNDIFIRFQEYVEKNTCEIGDVICRFTDLDAEAVDELELPEMKELVTELLKVNGFTKEKMADFFTKVAKGLGSLLADPEGKLQKEAAKVVPMNFMEKVPDIMNSFTNSAT